MRIPFFSIIVPIYKIKTEYIHICINSILKQSFFNIELILIDDGSPDQCGSICDKYAEMDRRVKVIHQDNQGVSIARNNGLKLALGKWIMFIDGDDWLEQNACEIIQERLNRRETDILVFRAVREHSNGIQTVDKQGMEYNKVYCTQNYNDRLLLYRKAMQPSNVSRHPVATCTAYYVWDKVYRRDLLISNNICFPENITNSEDKIFYLDCLQKIKTIQYIDNVLYHYRILSTGATYRYSESIDVNRKACCLILKNIALNMDNQLSELIGSNQHIIESDYILFTYMISSSILLRKYYHQDCPLSNRERREGARRALNEEPFRSAIHKTRYRELSLKEMARKWLLVHKCYFLFAFICHVKKI